MLQKDLTREREILYSYLGMRYITGKTDPSVISSIKSLKDSMTTEDFHTIVAYNDYEAFYQACTHGSRPIISILLGYDRKHKDAALSSRNYRGIVEAALLMDYDTVENLAQSYPHHQKGIAKAFIDYMISGTTTGADIFLMDRAFKIVLPSVAYTKEVRDYAKKLPMHLQFKWFSKQMDLMYPPEQEVQAPQKPVINGRKSLDFSLDFIVGSIATYTAIANALAYYVHAQSYTYLNAGIITLGTIFIIISLYEVHLNKNHPHNQTVGNQAIINFGKALEYNLIPLLTFVGKSIIDATGFCIASIKTLCSTASEPAERTQAVIDHKPATFPSHDHKQGFGREHF